jgi:hypothetical protein
MAEEDGRRRLSLVRKPVEVQAFERRVPAPCTAIGVAEVVAGQSALDWAGELALALAPRRPLTFVALSFAGEPVLHGALRERLERGSVPVLVGQVKAHADGLAPIFERLLALPPRLWLCVGEPALALLHPWFEVLLGTEAPPSRWLPALRPRAGHAQLELPQARLSLARAVGERLSPP